MLALLLRATGADYGYFHGDERINEAAKVLTGQLVPGQFFYPPFINYLNAVALAGLFPVGMVAGWWDSPGSFRAQYFDDPTVFYVTARYVTALCGAALAPLFYAIARTLRLPQPAALALGLLGALFPLGVFLGHIAKGDTALATCTVAVFFALLKRLDADTPRRWDIATGLMVMLALSFKQSAIFILGPLGLAYLILIARSEGLGRGLRSLGLALLVVVILWPLLNIGLMMDLRGFLDYQNIQAVMSVQAEDALRRGLETFSQRTIELVFGLNPIMALTAVLTPLLILLPQNRLPYKPALLAIWSSLTIATLIVCALTGARQPEHLWVANYAGYLLLGGLALAGLMRCPDRAIAMTATLTLCAGLILTAWGAVQPVRQALATPIIDQTDDFIRTRLSDRKILTSMTTHLPQAPAAWDIEQARMERLADKYNVALPERAAERQHLRDQAGEIFYVNMPGVMYGLENVDEDDVTYKVQAHAWPLQKEEWHLPYWRNQGYDIIITRDLSFFLNDSPSDLQRNFYADLTRTCRTIAHFDPVKPLYLEQAVDIFDCVRQP
ncbi:MAG: glycosyltransferase family 39 protein [Thalassovita sp.]